MIVSTTAHPPHLIGSALAGPPTFIYAALHNKSRVFLRRKNTVLELQA
jgi:hypothetical protein